MWNAIRAATAGLQAQQYALDVAANNLANAQTTGFKRQRVDPVDLPPAPSPFGAPGGDGTVVIAPYELGQGSAPGAVVTHLGQGPLVATGRPLDIAIAGEGLLTVTLPDGQTAYTRDGALHLDGAGRLTTAAGALVAPPITVPAGARAVTIARDGRVLADLGTGEPQTVGQLQLVRFANPDGLQRVGQNLFVATAAAGPTTSGAPGSAGFGALVAGSLEGSNVEVGEDLVRVIQAQRAYQVNSRVLRMLDEMLQATTSLVTR